MSKLYTAVSVREADADALQAGDIPLENLAFAPKRRRADKLLIASQWSLPRWNLPLQQQVAAKTMSKNVFICTRSVACLMFEAMHPVKETLESKDVSNPLLLSEVGWSFSPSYGNLRWIKTDEDGTFTKLDEDGNIVLLHVENQNTTILAKAEEILDDKTTKPLTNSKPTKEIPEDIGKGKVALAMWSPVAHTVAWIRDNDLFITIDGDKEIQITNDGSKNIINGISDWVYEGITVVIHPKSLVFIQITPKEEVFGAHESMWFSPLGSRVAYLKFNETLVQDFRMDYYMTPPEAYPRHLTIKYPKAGSPNPVVSLHIATPDEVAGSIDLAVIFDPNENFDDESRLIVEVVWLTEISLLVRLMNRVQDHQRLFIVGPNENDETNKLTWIARMVRDEASTDGAWFNLLQAAYLIPPSGDRNFESYIECAENSRGFMHISYYRAVTDSKPTMWLTSGPFEVTQIVSIDPIASVIYYMSTEEGSTQRHLYSVQLDGSEKNKLTPPKGFVPRLPFPPFNSSASDVNNQNIGFYAASFSPMSHYYILKYQGPGVPWSKIYRIAESESVESFDVLNDSLYESLIKKDLPKIGIMTIPNGEGYDLNARFIVPPDFDDSGQKKYPVLMKVYGGPSSQMVSYQFSIDFMTALAGSLGFISVIVDGRGTGFKGRNFRACVSKNLGHFETIDQIAAG
ncbi:diacylglycerol pyrophosphate phosphatase, partial [Nowakowskiella sp. JEL0078]